MLAKKTVIGAGWMVSSRFLGRLIDFCTLLILARILTPADFGLVALAMSLIAIVDTVLEIPVTQALIRLQHVDKAHLDTAFTLNMMRSTVIALFVAAAAWPFSVFYEDHRLLPLLCTLALSPILRGFYSPAMVLHVRNLSFRQVFFAEVAGKIAAFAIAVGSVLAGAGYWGLAVNTVTAVMIAAITSQILAPYRPNFSLEKLDQFAGFIGWFSLSQFISAINWQFDRVLLGRFAEKDMLGRYTVASDFSVLPTQSIIGPAMQPVMSAFSSLTDRDRVKPAFLRAARYVMIVSAPMAVGIALTADLIVEVLLGDKWHGAERFLEILSVAVLPIPYLQILVSLAVSRDAPQIAFRLNLIDLCVRVVLIVGGLYFLHIYGVAIARCLVAFGMFPFFMYYARQLCGASFQEQLRNLATPALATAVMAMAVLGFRALLAGRGLAPYVELPLAIAAGGLSYAAALYACGLQIKLEEGRFLFSDTSLSR